MLRTFKDAVEPIPWIADFLYDLTERSFLGSAPAENAIFVTVPHRAERSWSPNQTIWQGVIGGHREAQLTRTRKKRVERGQVDSSAYDASTIPKGANVILLDDLWTTGATIASAAVACRDRAATVRAWTVGRQLRPDTPPAATLYKILSGY